MFQFGEIITLIIGIVTVVYVLINRQRIGEIRPLRLLILPFCLMAVAWAATVLEGIPAAEGTTPTVVFWQQSASLVREGGIISGLLNLVEHTSEAAAGVILLLFMWRVFRSSPETDA